MTYRGGTEGGVTHSSGTTCRGGTEGGVTHSSGTTCRDGSRTEEGYMGSGGMGKINDSRVQHAGMGNEGSKDQKTS